MNKIELTEYINKLAYDFRETVIKNIKLACLIRSDEARDEGITLHGDDYFYVRNGLVVGIRYERLLLDIDDEVICEFTEVKDGKKKGTGMYLKGMPIEMILDMIQNFPVPSYTIYRRKYEEEKGDKKNNK